MKHSPVFLCTALLLTGCMQQTPAGLTERQVQILEAVGLPADYDELTPTQQHTVTRIEEMLCYMEQKYGGEFISTPTLNTGQAHWNRHKKDSTGFPPSFQHSFQQ